MNRTIIKTDDGSHTVLLADKQITYHSHHGAVQETMHVFIHAGLHYAMQQFQGPLKIFEMGFGTGLNAFATLVDSLESKREIFYTAVETEPLTEEEVRLLDYSNGEHSDLFLKLHEAGWETQESITNSFTLTKFHTELQSFKSDQRFHLVYYDAFAPSAQPELWTKEVFEKIFEMMVDGGILTTYCSKGDVRRAIAECGFEVTKLQGPKGKREMVRAVRPRAVSNLMQ